MITADAWSRAPVTTCAEVSAAAGTSSVRLISCALRQVNHVVGFLAVLATVVLRDEAGRPFGLEATVRH